MERFRLRALSQPKKGLIWELKMFPDSPRRLSREADGRTLGEISAPESVLWLRRLADEFLRQAEPPIAAEDFGPDSEPRWLKPEHGMRLALAFSAARWLARVAQRRRFRDGLLELPSEVVLYWFTLCFYGYRQAAGRAALRTLLVYEGPDADENGSAQVPRRGKRAPEPTGPLLFNGNSTEGSDLWPSSGQGLADVPKPATAAEHVDQAAVPEPKATDAAPAVRRSRRSAGKAGVGQTGHRSSKTRRKK